MSEDRTLRHTAQQLKQKFLDAAEPLVEQYVGAALGESELKSTNASAREAVWELLSKLMIQAGESLELDIQSAEDVIKAVTAGKCTMEEGQALLKLYKTAKEIDQLDRIPGGAGSGLTINILSTGNGASQTRVIEHAPNQFEE